MRNIHPPDDGVSWLLLDLNSYFAACEQQDRPALRGRPIAVVPVLADTTVVIAASVQAKAFGIKTGMKVGEAKQRCPGLVLVPAHHELYTRLHQEIVKAVDSCLPVEQVLSIDEMACRLTRDQCLLPNAIALAQRVKQTIRDRVGQCLTSSVGLARNQLLAKIASDMKKPDGLTILLPADLPHKLYALGLRDLPGIGSHMEKRLKEAGIDDLPALWAADERKLRAIWGGVGGARFHAMLHGEDVIWPIGKTRSLGHEHVLEPRLRTRDGALDVARQLVIRAAERLRRERLYCRRLALQVTFIGGAAPWDSWQSFTETQDTLLLLRVLARLWRDCPSTKPLRIGISLADVVAAKSHQGDLFEYPERQKLNAAIDGLNEKFGRRTVVVGITDVDRRGHDAKIAFHRVPSLAEF